MVREANRPASNADVVKVIKSLDGINRRLRALLFHKVPIKVTFPSDSDKVYETRVMSINSNKNQYLIRHILPINGHQMAVEGIKFDMQAHLQGGIVFTIKDCQIIKQMNYQGMTTYLMHYPDHLEHNQQRDSFRAEAVSTTSIVLIINSAKRHKTFRAQLLDLSNTGCKAEFNAVIKPEFQSMEVLEYAQIKFPDSREFFPIKLETRHTVLDEEKGKTVCGFRFIDNIQILQSQIDKTVSFMQIEARRIEKEREQIRISAARKRNANPPRNRKS